MCFSLSLSLFLVGSIQNLLRLFNSVFFFFTIVLGGHFHQLNCFASYFHFHVILVFSTCRLLEPLHFCDSLDGLQDSYSSSSVKVVKFISWMTVSEGVVMERLLIF